MEKTAISANPANPVNSDKDPGIFSKTIIHERLQVPFVLVDKRVKDLILKSIRSKIEGKCIIEGYVQPNSISIVQYSSGRLMGKHIEFDVVFECNICNPVENMEVECYAKNITQAGIRAFTSKNEKDSPLIIYLSREHHSNNMTYFNTIKTDDGHMIHVRIIGVRFELNDKHISVIGELISSKK